MSDSLEQAVGLAERFAGMSPEAQRIVVLLGGLPSRLADPRARVEVRAWLKVARKVGLVDGRQVEIALVVLAAFEGELGGEGGEAVRLVG